MARLTIRLPDELKERMDEYEEINWSALVRRCVRITLRELEEMDFEEKIPPENPSYPSRKAGDKLPDVEDIRKEMRELGIPNVDKYSVHELRAWKAYANVIGNLEDTIEKLEEKAHKLSREVRELEQSIQVNTRQKCNGG